MYIIEGVPRTFTPIRQFRAAHDLPSEFAVSLFEPKDYTGLGSMEQAGRALSVLRDAVLNTAPEQQPARAWLGLIDPLTQHFRTALVAVNSQVGLRDVEIDFAASGFGDVLSAVVYARVRDSSTDFVEVYASWLLDSIRVSHTVHQYRAWQIRVITHAYGRFGLECRTAAVPETSHYVYDAALACPAQGFMESLLSEVAQRVL